MLLKGKKLLFELEADYFYHGFGNKKHIHLNDHKLFLRIIIMKNNINSNYTYSFVQTSVNSEIVY